MSGPIISFGAHIEVGPDEVDRFYMHIYADGAKVGRIVRHQRGTKWRVAPPELSERLGNPEVDSATGGLARMRETIRERWPNGDDQ